LVTGTYDQYGISDSAARKLGSQLKTYGSVVEHCCFTYRRAGHWLTWLGSATEQDRRQQGGERAAFESSDNAAHVRS